MLSRARNKLFPPNLCACPAPRRQRCRACAHCDHSPPAPPGLKRYFHGKRMAGLLSARGLRILDYGCDTLLDDPTRPVALWDVIERWAGGRPGFGAREVQGGVGLQGCWWFERPVQAGAAKGEVRAGVGTPALALTCVPRPTKTNRVRAASLQGRHLHVGRQRRDLRPLRNPPRLGVAHAPAPRPRGPRAGRAAAARGLRAAAPPEQGPPAGRRGGHGVPHGPHLQPLRAVAAGGGGAAAAAAPAPAAPVAWDGRLVARHPHPAAATPPSVPPNPARPPTCGAPCWARSQGRPRRCGSG
jgi:hypothetical protein